MIRHCIDARVLDRECARDSVDLRTLAVLLVWPAIDLEARVTIVAKMCDESIYNVAVVH